MQFNINNFTNNIYILYILYIYSITLLNISLPWTQLAGSFPPFWLKSELCYVSQQVLCQSPFPRSLLSFWNKQIKLELNANKFFSGYLKSYKKIHAPRPISSNPLHFILASHTYTGQRNSEFQINLDNHIPDFGSHPRYYCCIYFCTKWKYASSAQTNKQKKPSQTAGFPESFLSRSV